MPTTAKSKRVLSGMRPTGRLHIGHYFGALQNWVNLQNDPANDCFYFIADWHALTSDYADTSAIAENSLQITIDYLAAGLDPTKSTIFLQSLVPEHAELHLLLSMVTPLGWLERVPTYKEQLDQIKNKDLHTYGFLGYPTLQTADIVVYSKLDETTGKLLPLYVPVGEDQVSHVEFSRELVHSFNFHFGFEIDEDLFKLANRDKLRYILQSIKTVDLPEDPLAELSIEAKDNYSRAIKEFAKKVGFHNFLEVRKGREIFFKINQVLTEPWAVLTPTSRIPGLDGRKMSKSYNNAITLSESDDDIRSKTKVMVTDPARKRRTDAGNPDICPVYDWHKLFSTPERDPGRLDWVRNGCTTAGIGCIECKAAMAENLIKWIEPVRARRVQYEQNPKSALEILDNGSSKARESAKLTMQRVRESIFNWNRKRNEITG